ncbi:MAG: hypothetical protein RL885_23390 [Planctomycetota bacterium]
MERIEYAGWENCCRLVGDGCDLVVTTDIGPRIIRYGPIDGPNMLCELPSDRGKTGGYDWRLYGGHRLWHAPENRPRTYHPDNFPVQHEWNGTTFTVRQPVEATTGVAKAMHIRLDPLSTRVTIDHVLTNHGPWDIQLAPWAVTVLAPGGRGILPQEPFQSHENEVLPVRPMALWGYTDLSDPRWTLGRRFIQLRQDPSAKTPQKIGFRTTRGWAAYSLGEHVFVKHFPFEDGATYPDMGCNFETFTNGDMLELESLGPLLTLEAGGGHVHHTEHWTLHQARIPEDEEGITKTLLPLVGEHG